MNHPTSKFDLHLSAYRIAPSTIKSVEALGFTRDEFANNTRCDTTAYHGTFRGNRVLPNNDLWSELQRVFHADTAFIGGLEEEEFDPSETVQLRGTSTKAPESAHPIGMAPPPSGTYKACDIHINISLEKTSAEALKYVDALHLASFDKPQEDGIHRVFSGTCQSVPSGLKLFAALRAYLQAVPNLVGKMKFERTTRFLRIPADAPALPLTSDIQLKEWLARQ